jgi:hypothetical protein
MLAIPLPKAISVAQFVPPVGEPTYTDIYNETVGSAPDPSVLDALLSEAGGLVDLMGQEIAGGVLDGALGAIGNVGAAFDPTSLDGNVGNYVAAIPAGRDALDGVGGLAIPGLLQLPISASFNGALGAPPKQSSVNLGTLKLGSAPLTISLGNYLTVHGVSHTYISATIPDGDPAIFSVSVVDNVNPNTDTGLTLFYFVVTPRKVGQFVGQLDVIGGTGGGGTIFTYTVTVQ